MKIRLVGAELFLADGENWQTDMTLLIVVFINFAIAPKNGSLWGYSSREIQSYCNRRGRNASPIWAVDQRTSEVVGKKQ